jgi:hypothetical protein
MSVVTRSRGGSGVRPWVLFTGCDLASICELNGRIAVL